MDPKILNDYLELINREKRFLEFFLTHDGDDHDAFLSEWFSDLLKRISNPIEKHQELDGLKCQLKDRFRGTEYEEIVEDL